jgi:hypothetical protein
MYRKVDRWTERQKEIQKEIQKDGLIEVRIDEWTETSY